MSQELHQTDSIKTESGNLATGQKTKILHTALVLTAISALLIALFYALGGDLPFAVLLFCVSAFSWLGVYLIRVSRAKLAALIYALVVYSAIFYAILTKEGLSNPALIALPAWIMTISFFFYKRAVLISTLGLILTLTIIYMLHRWDVLTLTPPPTLDQLILVSIMLAVTGIMVWTISGLHNYQITDFMGTFVSGVGALSEDHSSGSSTSGLEERFHHLAQTTTDAIMLLASDGKTMFVNRAAELIFSASAQEILGRPFSDFLSEPNFEELLKEINQTLSKQDEIQAHDLDGFGKRNGEDEFPIRLSYSAWRSSTDKYVCVVLRDLTEQLETEKWLVFQERLGTLGSLVAGVAHDFNNALMPIGLHIELLLHEPSLDQETRQILELVLQQAQHAGELSKQLLSFSSQTQTAFQPADLKGLLKDIETLLKRTFPENISLELAIRPGTYYLLGDPNRLQQALMNLAINARDAMPAGGQLLLRLSHQAFSETNQPPFKGMAPGNWLRLDISDTGEGILAEHLPHIFEPFFTTKEEGDGYGLGLAQTYNIVKQHDGFIDVVSRFNRGTTFTLYFPPLEGEEPLDLQDVELEALMGEGQLILLVEDDQQSLQALTLTLEHLDYRVMGVVNGQQALQAYAADTFDIVISDVVMPDMSGIDLFDRLIKLDPSLKMLFISGYPAEDLSSQLSQRSLAAPLSKPASMVALAKAVKKALEQTQPAG